MIRRFLTIAILACVVMGVSQVSAGTVGSKFDVNLYGYVKLDAVYDSQRNAVGDIELFVMPERGEKDSEFTMTARQSRFGFNVSAPETDSGLKSTARVEGGFWGEEVDPDQKTKFRLRVAYADVAGETWSFRAGQDWDTFITVIPKSINFTYLGWQGSPGYRRAQARLTKTCKMGGCTMTSKLAAARTLGELYNGVNDGDADGQGQNDGEDSGVPSAQANLIFDTKIADRPCKFSVSGTWGVETLDGVTTNGTFASEDETDYDTWLLMASFSVPVVDAVTLQGAYWEGENLDAYEAGIGLGINTTKDTSIAASGGWAQLMIGPKDSKLSYTVTYGVDDPKDEDLNGGRSRNEFFMASVYYKWTEAVTVALELSQLQTTWLGADGSETVAENDRAHGAVFYFF